MRVKLRMASARVMPSASVRASCSGVSLPVAASEERKGKPKRTPSSSAKAMSSMWKGRGVAPSCSMAARARRTPRGPSKAPALVTVSMWEKRTKVGASGCAEWRVARRLPASSVRAVRWAWRIHHSRRVWASRVAGERKRRVVWSGMSVMRASSRQREMMVVARAARDSAVVGV